MLDHILISKPITDVDYDVVHINAEFADQASDHDPQLVRIRPVAPTARGTVDLTPSTVAVGRTVSVSMAGWDPGAPLTVTLDGSALTSVTADADGNATARIRIPADTSIGPHRVTVGAADGTATSASLTVTPPPVRKGIVLSGLLVTAGSSTGVLLLGWSPRTTLELTLDGSTPLETVTSDAIGAASIRVRIPVGTRVGVHRIVATGWDGTSAHAAILVLPGR